MAYTQVKRLNKIHSKYYSEVLFLKTMLNKYISENGAPESLINQAKEAVLEVERMNSFLVYLMQQIKTRDLKQLEKELASTKNSYYLLKESYDEALEESKKDTEGYKNVLNNISLSMDNMLMRAAYAEAFSYLLLLPKRDSKKKSFDRVYPKLIDNSLLTNYDLKFFRRLYTDSFADLLYYYLDNILKVSEVLTYLLLQNYTLSDEDLKTFKKVLKLD